MSATRLATAFLVCLGLAGLARPASAQIYSCKDANGTIILSDQRGRCDAARSYAVGRSTIRTTRPVTAAATGPYDGFIERYAGEYGLSGDLVRAVIQVESGFNPRARSPKGAMGLMQLMPATAAEFGVTRPYSPEQNIRGGVAYLRSLMDRYGWDETLALAAYNAGPTAVEKYGNAVPPYRETKQYVSRVQNLSGPSIPPNARVFYKTIDIVNGQPVPKYSNTKPSSGPYEVVTF